MEENFISKATEIQQIYETENEKDVVYRVITKKLKRLREKVDHLKCQQIDKLGNIRNYLVNLHRKRMLSSIDYLRKDQSKKCIENTEKTIRWSILEKNRRKEFLKSFQATQNRLKQAQEVLGNSSNKNNDVEEA